MQVRPPRREDNPAEGNGNPLQYSCLENPMDRAAWQGYSPRCRRVRHDGSDLARKRRNTYESVLTGGGEPRAYYTERSKISRKTNTLMHIYKWNSGRWYWQRSCGGAGAEPGFTDPGREREGRRNRQGTAETYALAGVELSGGCKNFSSALLNFAIWYHNTFLNKCSYVIKKEKTDKHLNQYLNCLRP